MKQWLLAIALVVVLAFANSCGTTAKARARNDMENSKATYEKCLRQNPDDPSKCEALKRAYEADFETYREASKAQSPIFTGFFEFGLGGSGK
jgi:membrane-bound lytic murein transglycosylase